MKQTRLMMGMPITIEIIDADVSDDTISTAITRGFDYFDYVDHKFSVYKLDSEISQINRGELSIATASEDMQTVFALAEQTKQDTSGYFDIYRNGRIDPSGLVKGWAIFNVAELIRNAGSKNFYVDAGGDIQAFGCNPMGHPWRTGIRSPFNMHQIVKVVAISDAGIATSGNYIRGEHIYNPLDPVSLSTEIVSLTVIGPNVYEADRFATAAFAMGSNGILFIDNLDGFEGYMIDKNGTATLTHGFEGYVCHD